MLVLNRRVGDVILIGESITVTVIQTKPGRVVLGIEAPEDIPIVRQETIKEQATDDR